MSRLTETFAAAAARDPEAPHLYDVGSGRRLTRGAFNAAADAAARALRAAGVASGDRVLIALPNGSLHLAAVYGAWRLGAVAAPVAPGSTSRELDAVAAVLRPRAFLRRDAAGAAGLECGSRTSAFDPLADAEAGFDGPPPADDAGALVIHTSGAAGRPKGVLLAHGALAARLDALREHFAHGAGTRALCLLPLSFVHALLSNVSSAWFAGGSAVVCPRFDVELVRDLWTLLAREAVTTFSAVPTVLRLLMRFPETAAGADLSALRFVTCASAPLPDALRLGFERTFGVPVLDCYGMTETASWVACQSRDAARRADGRLEPLAGQDFRVRDGELEVRGPAFEAYLGRPDLTAAALRDGWLRTGDLADLDAGGRLSLLGRRSELIGRAGVDVHPDAVDARLAEHPAVAESATVGLPDDLLGERVAAFVVLHPGAGATRDELLAHCRTALSEAAGPDEIHFLESLPKNARGKVARAELRK